VEEMSNPRRLNNFEADSVLQYSQCLIKEEDEEEEEKDKITSYNC
jgi:hypothetical protein